MSTRMVFETAAADLKLDTELRSPNADVQFWTLR